MRRALAIGLAGAALVAVSGKASAQLVPTDGATLRGLDKITGRATDKTFDVDQTVVFGSLKVTLRACYQAPPEEQPESAAFLEIEDLGVGHDLIDAAATPSDPDNLTFSGWMFASSPGLNALEHPVYDVWVIKCSALPPEYTTDFDPSSAETNDPGSVEGEAAIEAFNEEALEDLADDADTSEPSFEDLLDSVTEEPSGRSQE